MSRKYYRKVEAKPHHLRVRYGKIDGEDDLVYANGKGTDRTDSYVLMEAFCHKTDMFGDIPRSILEELIERGYDITTLDFSIKKLDNRDSSKVKINEEMKHQLKKRP